jgi:hypothetical protein
MVKTVWKDWNECMESFKDNEGEPVEEGVWFTV